MAKPIFILNGPNLGQLGRREPAVYGTQTLDDVRAACAERAKDHGYTIDFRQTDSEAELIAHVHDALDAAAAVVINPAAFSHTSIALHDALKMLDAPLIEVHLSNPVAREPFRSVSYVSLTADGVISGLGIWSYVFGVEAACRLATPPLAATRSV